MAKAKDGQQGKTAKQATDKQATEKKPMTVQEAGRRGGSKVSALYGHDFYVGIGKKGGGRVRDLIAAGKAAIAAETDKATKGKKK